jgi:hypothetical protein
MTQLAILDEEKEGREILQAVVPQLRDYGLRATPLGMIRTAPTLRRASKTRRRKCWLDFAARKLTLNEKGSCQLPLQKN